MATTGKASMTTVSRSVPQVTRLLSRFQGTVLQPGTDAYGSARRATLVPGRPAYILRPQCVEDVSSAVRVGAASGLPVAVRGGGHSFAGLSSNTGGIVVDLGELTEVTMIDEQNRIVRVGGGATWGDVLEVLQPLGLALSSGDTKSVGVGGLTLGGGIGWKVRSRGLALDNLVAAEVVTASGELLRTTASEHPDLFWAIRGGGGNFGIVSAFEFAAHRTTDVFFGRISFPARERGTVLQGWANHLRHAPRQLTSVATLANPFAGGAAAPVDIVVAFDGDDEEAANRAIDPIRRLGTAIREDVARVPYAETLEPGGAPPAGIHFLTRSGFVEGTHVASALDVLAEVAGSPTSPFISIRSLGGAVADVPRDATAYAHRTAELMVVTFSIGSEAAIDTARPVVRSIWDRLAPDLEGAYANFLTSATREDVSEVYPRATYTRLSAIKHRHDPGNLFSGNHNVLPEAPR